MRFRKKQIEVEAVQWFPGVEIPGVEILSGRALVTTIHGDKIALSAGDWVITEPDGFHHYPCKANVFEATYEKVGE